MKKIIGNMLYDTEKAEKIFSFRSRRKTGEFGSLNFYDWFDVDIYKTKKGNYFIHGYIKDKPSYENFIEEISENEVKEIIKELDPDKYISLGYEVKEA